MVAGYTETGRQLYLAPALGSGLNLPSSESLSIPVLELDYIEITVPGDGSNLRGAFLCTLARSQVRHALDFEAPTHLQDPFGNAAGEPASENDAFLSGRVRATIADLPTPCSSQSPALFEFALETVPQMAVFRFELLGADPVHPPEFLINQQGPASPALQLPDLADPAYLSRRLPLETDSRFQYTGWLPGQLAVPFSALRTGVNQLWIRLPAGQLPVAVRSVSIDLKYPSSQLHNPSQP